MKWKSLFVTACLGLQASAVALDKGFKRFNAIEHPDPEKRAQLQDIVSYFHHSSALSSQKAYRRLDHLGREISLHQWRTNHDI
jgi:hypothetical protein